MVSFTRDLNLLSTAQNTYKQDKTIISCGWKGGSMAIFIIIVLNLTLNFMGFIPSNLMEFQLWHAVLLIVELLIAWYYMKTR